MASNRSRHPDSGLSPCGEPRWDAEWQPDRIGLVLSRVQLPLSNAEFALEQYLLSNGPRLDTESRMLLAGVRDCIARVAVTARHLSLDDKGTSSGVERAA